MRIRAISLDLDDTLWPVLPALALAEAKLDAWLNTHHPEVAQRYPVQAMRALREEIAAERDDLAHDFSAQRRLTLTRAFERCGRDCAPVEEAFAVYFAARNQVEPYADSVQALTRMARHVPLVSLSNGNADLALIGLDHLFQARFSAREVGVAKPHPDIFEAVRAHLDLPASEILHVGDDPVSDVAGAREAGFRTAWINREGTDWPTQPRADLELTDLTALADLIEHRASSSAP
ncbi:HAD family hydrolase [Oleiagrimonas sp. C23AA]|uniref:HAD family hydrolase n=1 Tax=Oleiagrimonas sp. C23AA TaxID=2719047 RepID=UPI00141D78DF|nr:HAD family hydrolase [Oleiagrimonas sp. C23AA]NII09667.1 HAD family hydrolase [Oleiagrimonas sp. C23AA]